MKSTAGQSMTLSAVVVRCDSEGVGLRFVLADRGQNLQAGEGVDREQVEQFLKKFGG
jgi:hypothetical protein